MAESLSTLWSTLSAAAAAVFIFAPFVCTRRYLDFACPGAISQTAQSHSREDLCGRICFLLFTWFCFFGVFLVFSRFRIRWKVGTPLSCKLTVVVRHAIMIFCPYWMS